MTSDGLTFLFFSWHSLHAIRVDLRFGTGSGAEVDADAGKDWPLWGVVVGSRARYLGGLRAGFERSIARTDAAISVGMPGGEFARRLSWVVDLPGQCG